MQSKKSISYFRLKSSKFADKPANFFKILCKDYFVFIFKYITSFLLLLAFVSCKKDKKDPMEDIFTLLLLQRLTSGCSVTSDGGGDPLYPSQWHLSNISQSGGTTGEDARVTSVWNQGVNGTNVNVAVVDDGLEETHEDLRDNVSTSISGINFITNRNSATHMYFSSSHGSSVGGVIAARPNNGKGGRGAAPCASLVGVDILEQNSISGTHQSAAMTYKSDSIFISNNSWGKPDLYGTYSAAEPLWLSGIDSGVSSGRNGKGVVYLWAAGNGATGGVTSTLTIDNSNYDNQANYYGVMAIGGIGENGKKAYYSEKGANVWAVAHTMGNNATAVTTGITTTDATGERGSNSSSKTTDLSDKNYTKFFSGTSSATPLASGVVALLLSKYPELTWRDVRELVAYSARKTDPTDSDWAVNSAGLNINHKYGFGAVDAESLLSKANTWTRISSSQQKVVGTNDATSRAIPDNNSTGVSFNYAFNGSVNYTEFVAIEITTAHTYYPELTIEMTSPTGTKSVLAENHTCLKTLSPATSCTTGVTTIASSTGSNTYRFGSARHLGENPNGNWAFKVSDAASGDTGSITGVRLTVYGR